MIAAVTAICAAMVPALPALAADAPRIERVAVQAGAIRMEVDAEADRSLRILELRPHQVYQADGEFPAVWSGEAPEAAIEIDRFSDQHDRLFSKFQLVDADDGDPLGEPRYVENPAALAERDFRFPRPESIKGLQAIVDIDDALALGIKHAGHNVDIRKVIDLGGGGGGLSWSVDGHEIPIDADYIARLDRQFKRLTDAGVSNTIILLHYMPRDPAEDDPLVHPATNAAEAPNGLGAFNLSDERGTRHYRAAVEFLAHRYSDPDKPHGWVSGYIIGNEIQAHWWWYNMGRSPAEDVVAAYARAMRVAHLATSRFHPGLRVYASMEHHWTASMVDEPLQFIPGREVIDRLDDRIESRGDFPWHVAFHPYPENLFDPATWEDEAAQYHFDTPKITFKNIEVLTEYLRQPDLLYEGEPRRVILSEQGFNLPEGEDGEELQAAGYAYAYHRIRQIDGIDAFLLHRHMDHPGEGGLRLGLRAHPSDPASEGEQQRLIYEVFRLADTERWREAFDFAKAVIGIDDWSEVRPRPVAPHRP